MLVDASKLYLVTGKIICNGHYPDYGWKKSKKKSVIVVADSEREAKEMFCFYWVGLSSKAETYEVSISHEIEVRKAVANVV